MVSIWFGLGALVAAILAMFNVNPAIQIVAFILVSALAVALTRPLVKKLTKGRHVPTNSDRHIGQQAIVLEEIKPFSAGTVKLDGLIWTAVTDEDTVMKPGEVIIVSEIRGAKVIAKKI